MYPTSSKPGGRRPTFSFLVAPKNPRADSLQLAQLGSHAFASTNQFAHDHQGNAVLMGVKDLHTFLESTVKVSPCDLNKEVLVPKG